MSGGSFRNSEWFLSVPNSRFARALDQFLRSKLMIDLKVVPGVLTWPGTTQVIEETRIENLQVR